MTFSESVSTCFSKYFVFKGRASRSEYWWFQLIVTPSFVISDFTETDISYLFLGIALVTLIPAISVGVRRLHDTNRSGFFLLIGFIPFIGGLILLFFLIPEGTKGKNKYGADPLVKRKTKKKKNRLLFSIFFSKSEINKFEI